MLKRLSCFALFLCALLLFGAEAKYVFLMIGDGFGENSRQLLLTQYPDSVLGKMGTPIPTGTLNVEGKTTDSAASGTAIACGIKTLNSRVGLDANGRPVMSLAKVLQAKGYKIGLVSSVGINDATPGAHAGNRMRGEIGIASDLYTNHFDFLGISKLLYKDPASFRHFCNQGLARAGYAISKDGTLDGLTVTSRKQGRTKLPLAKAKKGPIAVFSTAPIAWEDWDGVSAAPVPTLAGFTEMAIKALDNPKGFFLMVEGGAIDHGNHHNDAGTMIHEAHEFDLAVAEALKFQAAHPEETLVVVTADHETGGLQILDKSAIRPDFAVNQKLPMNLLAKNVAKMMEQKKSDKEIFQWLCDQVGIRDLTADETKKLAKAMKAVLAKQTTAKDKMTGYGNYNPLVIAAFQIRDARNGIKYTTSGHTETKISTLVKGSGAELFKEPLENSDIPHRISIAMLGDDKDLSAGLTPLPYAPKAVDYLVPRTASYDKLMFQFGTIGKAPQKLELTDASGKVIKSVSGKDVCGFETFDGLTPDTEYTLEMTKADGTIQKAVGRTLPQPKGKKLFSFIVLSDMHYSCHGDIPFGRVVSFGPTVLKDLVKFANDNNIAAIIEPGDCADASRDEEYAAIMKIMKDYKGFLLVTPGNHDRSGEGYNKFFGNKAAGIQEINGVQFVWLATGGPRTGFLGKKPNNAEVMKQYDPNRPAVIFTHYQLTKDARMTDKDRAIHDQDKTPQPEVQAMLDKIASAKSTVIYIGHKNSATDVKLGNCWQINCPQPTQFPCGFLLVDVYEDGLLQHYMPATEARVDETSRHLGGGTVKQWQSRDGRSFEVWNRFLPMEIAK